MAKKIVLKKPNSIVIYNSLQVYRNSKTALGKNITRLPTYLFCYNLYLISLIAYLK